MSFSLSDLNLPAFEDDVRATFTDASNDISAAADNFQNSIDTSDLGRVFDGSAFRDVLERSGLDDFNGNANIQNLNDIAGLAEQLPGGLGDPDATGEATTGLSTFGRETAATLATLSAAPRIVDALGPDAQFVETRGVTFEVTERYVDPQSGFLALRLTPTDGGIEVFAVDGLQVGSRADEVAAATLGRLQVESDAFRDFVNDASAVVTAGGMVEFTGPSLGGAIAQVAAYETAEALAAVNPSAPQRMVQVVTVDALGGRDAAEAINGGTVDPDALNLINAFNIRTEGDVVSRIGSHIGASYTFQALDAQGNVVQLDAADAHVNIVSLLQNLNSDTLYNSGNFGAPAEISGFAAASNAASDALIQAWLASGETEDGPPAELQVPGNASFDASLTTWSLDADANGTVDLAVRLSAPASAATQDIVLG